jgi:adenylylsulfate reductase, subunit B
MGIRKIDYTTCIGCGICVEHCPMDVIRMNKRTKRPYIAYLKDCQSCYLCEHDCPVEGTILVVPVRERRVPLPW